MPTELELALNHLRAALRNATVLLIGEAVLGGIGGFALSFFRTTVAGAVIGAAIPWSAAGWLAWKFYETRGLMHTRLIEMK